MTRATTDKTCAVRIGLPESLCACAHARLAHNVRPGMVETLVNTRSTRGVITYFIFLSPDSSSALRPARWYKLCCIAHKLIPRYFVTGQIDNWNHLYLSIFPVGHSVVLLSLRTFPLNHNLTRHICCLLYTSPSPRDKRQSRMPSSA